jgi:hypothetical protein
MLVTLMRCNSGFTNMCSLWPVQLFIYMHSLRYYKTLFMLQFIYFKIDTFAIITTSVVDLSAASQTQPVNSDPLALLQYVYDYA